MPHPWSTSTHPIEMLYSIRDISDRYARPLRLFAYAMYRIFLKESDASYNPFVPPGKAVSRFNSIYENKVPCELCVDSKGNITYNKSADPIHKEYSYLYSTIYLLYENPFYAAYGTLLYLIGWKGYNPSVDNSNFVQYCDILRDMIPEVVSTELTPQIQQIQQTPHSLIPGSTKLTPPVSIYENYNIDTGHLDPNRLKILSDYLEENGCQDVRVLSALRDNRRPKYVGFWPIELLYSNSISSSISSSISGSTEG